MSDIQVSNETARFLIKCGKQKLSIDDVLRVTGLFKLEHKCSKCSGTGYLTDMVDTYPKHLPDSGYATRMESVKFDCDLCGGIGFTEHRYKKYKPEEKPEIKAGYVRL